MNKRKGLHTAGCLSMRGQEVWVGLQSWLSRSPLGVLFEELVRMEVFIGADAVRIATGDTSTLLLHRALSLGAAKTCRISSRQS